MAIDPVSMWEEVRSGSSDTAILDVLGSFFPVVHYLLIFVFVWLCFLSLKRMVKYQISFTKWYQPWAFFYF